MRAFGLKHRLDGEIVALALPALGALAADPLVSLVDTAFVGRIGTEALGALGIATAIFNIVFFIFNFLAYGTTPLVAGAVARGRADEAGRIVVTAFLIAAGAGVMGGLVLAGAAGPLVRVMGAAPEVVDDGRVYLAIRALAVPAVLLVTVGHGAFRGYQDTRTPLVVTLGLNLVNLVLDPVLIFGFDLGIRGAAIATVIAQWMGAGWFLVLLLVRRRSRLGIVDLRPSRTGLRALGGAGGALVIRTGALVAALTLSTRVAASISTVAVAAHQVAMSLWVFLALVVDALAIAGQAMIGRFLGGGTPDEARAASHRLLVLGAVAGLGLAAAMALLQPVLPGLFAEDPDVVAAVESVYPFVVGMQPLNALVFVWDGLAIGASAFRFLAGAMVAAFTVAAAVLGMVALAGWGLAAVWWAIVVLMLARAGLLAWWQVRGPLGSSAS